MNDIVFRHGQFVWREIMTPDVEKTTRFYGETLGWKSETVVMPDGGKYTMLKAGDRTVGGCMELPMAGIPPHWALYVSVADVDASAKQAIALGGRVMHGPLDVGGIGRFAALLDPQGAAINVWKSGQGDGARTEKPGQGEFCWEQLNGSDLPGASTFYAALFGWTKQVSGAGMDVWNAGDAQVASVMQAPPGTPPHWLTYVVVDNLAAANARAEKNGGKILVAKIDVPTVGSISVVQDNVGAVLGLFEAPTA